MNALYICYCVLVSLDYIVLDNERGRICPRAHGEILLLVYILLVYIPDI